MASASLFSWSPETWTAIGTLALAVATVLLASVAVFAEPLRRRFSRTRVSAVIRAAPPDMHQIEMTSLITGETTGKALYARLRVSNEGSVAAENVEVFVSEVRSVEESTSEVVPTFLPLSLTWSHFSPPSSIARIPSRLYRHCDLGRFQPITGRVVFVMSTIVQPNPVAGGAIPHVLEPGRYEVDLTISGDNIAPTTSTLHLNFDGSWDDDEAAMIGGITLRALN